tara:strand:- start:3070 stop:3282 length:213 start_codon:yes stop_codon:yes gene_type:complete
MIRPIVGEGFFLSVAPRDPSALVCVLEADYMVYVNEVAVLVGVEAYGSARFVTIEVEVRAIVAIGKDRGG